MTNTDNYGRYYWCIKVPKTVSQSGEIYVLADEVKFDNGTAVFIGGYRNLKKEEKSPEHPQVVLALNPKSWTAVFAASVFDGSAIAVDRWKGEIVERAA